MAVLSTASALCVPVGSISASANDDNCSICYSVNNVNMLGKTNIDTSIYGYDLEDNMIENTPELNKIQIVDNEITVNGCVDAENKNTDFNLIGTVYKTNDGNIVCDAYDSTNKYDVIFLCLERTQEHNDYVLYRDTPELLSETIGDYGLKIYLMKKGTRDISILEDVNVTIDNQNQLLTNIEQTEYSNLNWFTKCFEPINDDNNDVPTPISAITQTTYTYCDSELYWFGSTTVELGVVLTATNNTPNVGSTGSTLFTSNLNHDYFVYSTNPSYNQPARASGHFRIENIRAEGTIGQGYYLQQIAWNGNGENSISFVSLSAYIGLSGRFGGASISPSFEVISFEKDNWYNLVNNFVSPTSVPRMASTSYTNLIISTPNHYASFNAMVTNDNLVPTSDKFKCYQTIWTFDITKKGLWGYSPDKYNQQLYCTSYFN